MSTGFYDRQGNPISPEVWAELNTNKAYWLVAETRVNDRTSVSTIWLGSDFGCGNKPVIYETVVFGSPLHNKTRRYCTEPEAIEGHRDLVALARQAIAAGAS